MFQCFYFVISFVVKTTGARIIGNNLNKIKQSEIGNALLLNLGNLSLNVLYCVIPSLTVYLEYKAWVASIFQFLFQPISMGKAKELSIQKTKTDHHKLGNGYING